MKRPKRWRCSQLPGKPGYAIGCSRHTNVITSTATRTIAPTANHAATRIPNLFLAADYVRTHTDLATMEGANEAARSAVNGILAATGSSAPRCEIWPLREPAAFAPAKALDRVRWKLFHRPAKPPLRVTDEGEVEPTGPVAAGLVRLGPLVRRLFG